MLDNGSIEIMWAHKSFGVKVELRKHGVKGIKERTLNKHVKVVGKHPWASLRVYSLDGGKRIRIKGCFPKFLQGHNAFGGNDMEWLCTQVVRAVFRELDIPEGKGLISAIRNADIYRADCTGGFRLESPNAVPAAIRAIKFAYLDCRGEVRSFGNETVYVKRIWRNTTILFYDKLRKWESLDEQVRHLPRGIGLQVKRYVRGLLRFEVRLFRDRLVRAKLDKVYLWKKDTVQNILVSALASVKVDGGFAVTDYEGIQDRLPSRMFRTYLLWKAGRLAAARFSSRHISRFRSECCRVGINIDIPPQDDRVVLALEDTLGRDKLRYRHPAWARRQALVAGLPNFSG